MRKKLPKLCVHAATGRYYIYIQRKPVYLGKCDGTREMEAAAEAARLRVLKEIEAGGGKLPASFAGAITVERLLERYLEWVDSYYRKRDGSATSEVRNIEMAVKPLESLYGATRADRFTPVCLEAVQRAMIDHSWMTKEEKAAAQRDGWCRKLVNRHVNRIKRMFKWAVSKGLVPAEVHQALTTVQPLRAGRSEARETTDVPPAPEESIAVVRQRVTPTVRAMIDVQLLTAARPGEVCVMRPCDIDRTGELARRLLGTALPAMGKVWVYLPGLDEGNSTSGPSQEHKTAHHGHKRVILIGPKAQTLLAPFLDGIEPREYVFSPARAEAARDAERKAARKTPVQPSQAARRAKRKPKKEPGQRYTTGSYAHAVAKACEGREPREKKQGRAADPGRPAVPHWHPHQLRHNAATRLQQELGYEVARIILGHRSLQTTQIYVKDDLEKALKAMERLG